MKAWCNHESFAGLVKIGVVLCLAFVLMACVWGMTGSVRAGGVGMAGGVETGDRAASSGGVLLLDLPHGTSVSTATIRPIGPPVPPSIGGEDTPHSPGSSQVPGGGVCLVVASVVITQSARVEDPDGRVYDVSSGGTVYNGDTVTYTLFLRNDGTDTVAVEVSDLLPKNALDRITCSAGCERDFDEEEVPLPSGGTILITITRRIVWSFPALAPGELVTMTFSGRIIGQPEGALFRNRVFVSGASNTFELVVGTRVPGGGATISEVPSWLSDDLGGTISQDWGDFDRDGDLDLVLGSSLGATVYCNEGGWLTYCWDSPDYVPDDPRHAYGVRWADLDGDPKQGLELVVVGNSVSHTLSGPGINYIYTYNPVSGEFDPTDVFTSEYQLVRVAPADYDSDGDVDLVASTNAINARPCTVRLYRNDGSGNFTGELDAGTDEPVLCPCISELNGEDATAALGASDYDGDGDVDLVVGVFPSTLRLLINQCAGGGCASTSPFTVGQAIDLETDLEYIPYDLAWGDYDLDGYHDLAVAYPLQRKVHIYHNYYDGQAQGRRLIISDTLRTVSFMTPLAIDWGDFDGDGRIDLAVADSRLAVYRYDEATGRFERIDSLGSPAGGGQVWSMRGVDLDNGGSLSLVTSNRDGPSRVFDAEASKLKTAIVQVSERGAGGVAWGDWDGDRDLDLLFGGAEGWLSSWLYLNDDGTFPVEMEIEASGYGPHCVAFGDVTGDGRLDVAVGAWGYLQVYNNGNVGDDPDLEVLGIGNVYSLAWGDPNDDKRLDLLVGGNGFIHLYLNQGTQLATSPAYTVEVAGNVRSLAWGDFDGDYYLDFAAGIDGGSVGVYRNFGDSSFDLVWQSPDALPTRAVAWADYDHDGDLDLAVGNYGADDYVWENEGGAFSNGPVWTSGTPISPTTSLAWGDWNNDGYPELAVGRDGAPDVVYANLDSGPGDPRLVAMWNSSDSYATTGVAWGDRDGDGDLDLAISQKNEGEATGFYENTLTDPAHLAGSEIEATSLPNSPPYVYVERPGDVDDAYFCSSAEVLGGGLVRRWVTITYRLYDPEEDLVSATTFEYSLDGGGTWHPATPAISSPVPITRTNSTAGEVGIFIWDADGVFSDDARFRVRVVAQEAIGPVQHATGSGISPPFRVRARNCEWPRIDRFQAVPIDSSDPQMDCYEFDIAATGSGILRYYTDFGDGEFTTASQGVQHCYPASGYYIATLIVSNNSVCTERSAYARLHIGGPPLTEGVYLPLALRSYASDGAGAAGVPAGSGGPRGPGRHQVLSPSPTPSAAQDPPRPPATASSARLPVPPRAASAVYPAAVDQSEADTAAYGGTQTTMKVTKFVLGVNSQPAINRDGSRIAFWSTGEWTGANPDGSIEIFLAEPGAFGRITYTQVTSSTGSVLGGFSLAPSLDDAGERLVFFSDMDRGENRDRNFEVFLAELPATSSSGISITQVTRTPRGVNVLPDISGDGRFIAFASDNDLTGNGDQFVDGWIEIYRAEVDSSSNVTFTRVTESHEEFALNDKPSISEDGRFIAFISDQDVTGTGTNADGNLEVFLAKIGAGGGIAYTQVTSSTLCVNDEPSISADGTYVALLSDCAGDNFDVFLYRVDDDTPEWRTITDGHEDHPSISADGSRIAYILNRRLYLYDVLDGRTIPPPASGPGGSGYNAYPVLSSDGGTVAFNYNWDIYVTRYPLADLKLSKSVSSNPTEATGLFSYTITITNAGPSPAPAIILTDVLPSGVEPAQSYAGERWDDTDLILMLHLEETGTDFIDATDYDNDAYCTDGDPGTCPTRGVPGKVGNALWFDTDDFVIVDSMSDFPDTEITVMFWVSSTDSSIDNTPLSYATSGHLNEVRVSNLAGLDAWFGDKAADFPNPVSDGQWHHVAVTWRRSTDRVQLYVDGDWKDTKLIGNWWCRWWWCCGWPFCQVYRPRGYTLHDGGSLVLGQNQISGGEFDDHFSGMLDEVAIYRRVLTSDEIYGVYVAQGGEDDPNNYTSAVMAQPEGAAGWSAISWMPSRPVGVDLPDYGDDEAGWTTYDEGAVDMSGNVLLLHLNEPAGYQGFLDTSGMGHDGYCDSEASCPTAGASGKLGNALQFDGGNNDYVNLGPAEGLEMDNHVSIEAWVYPTGSGDGIIVNKEGEYEVAVEGGAVQWAFANTGPGWDWVDTGLAVLSGQWTHVAVVYDVDEIAATGVVTTYVNGGDLVHTRIVSGSIGDNDPAQNDFRIGGRQCCDQYFTGSIDEVAVFDRPLTAGEVRDHYLRGALEVRFDVHSCDDPVCSGKTLGDPYPYPDHTSPYVFPPAFAIDVPDNPYFQYRVTSTSTSVYSPGLQSVTVHPWVQCSSSAPVTCTIGTEIAPLDPGAFTSVVLPVVVPKTAVFPSSNVVLTNTAIVQSTASDHVHDNVAWTQSSLYSECWVRRGDEYYVDLQVAVDVAEEGDTLQVAGTCVGVGKRSGTYQTLYLSKTVTIRGGYTTTNGLADPPNPVANPTTLNAVSQGGVVYIAGDVSPTLEGLRITGGAPVAGSVGGGIHVVTATATISGCRVFSNTAEAEGGGVYLGDSDSLLVGNVIVDNQANYGGGVYLYQSDAVLSGNQVLSNTGSEDGGGVYLYQSDAAFSGNVIQSNTADGDGGGGLYVVGGSSVMTNTIVATNEAGNGGGLYVTSEGEGTRLGMLHTTLVGNNAAGNDELPPEDVGDGIYVGEGSLALTNTIVTDHEVGVYREGGGSVVSLESTLWWGNGQKTGGSAVDARNNYEGDPVFTDAPAGDYHIESGSAAIDRGVSAGVATDLDGHPRGRAPDLGAYEARYAMQVSKEAHPSLTYPGGHFTYTVIIANTGYGNLTGVVVTDTLPASGITYAGPITWAPGALAAGAIWTATMPISVNVDYIGTLTNVVQATSDQGVGGVYTHTLPAAYILDFSQSVYSVEEDVGDAIVTVELTPVSAQTVTVAYETQGDTATPGQDYFSASGTLTFTPGVTSLTFTVTILEDQEFEPSEALTLTLSDPSPAGSVILGDTNPAVLLIVGAPWRIPGRIEAEDYDAGENGETYYDTTPGNQLGEYREDDVDIGDARGSDSRYRIGNTKAGEWLSYTVEVAATGTYTMEVQVTAKDQGGAFHVAFDGAVVGISMTIPDTGGSWERNWVVLSQTVDLEAGRHTMAIVFETNGTGVSAGSIDWVGFRAPVLTVTKSASATVQAGSLLTYTIVVSNTGNADAIATVTDTIPISTTFAWAEPAGSPADGEVRWDGLVVPAGDGLTLTFAVTVTSPLTDGTVITNATYGVTCTQGMRAIGVPVTTTVESAPVLTITKGASATVQAGGLLTYTIVVSNTGNADATGVVVTDTIPANTTFAWAEPAESSANGEVEWNGRTVPAGDGLALTFAVTVTSPLDNGTVITNAMYGVTCTQGVSAAGEPVVTTVESAPVLTITKGAAATVQAGGLLTYTIVVSNTGNANATGVIVTDTIPISTTFARAESEGSLANGEVKWSDKTVPAGGSLALTFVVTTSGDLNAGDVITNTTYGVTCAQGVSAAGIPVTTTVQGALVLRFWLPDHPTISGGVFARAGPAAILPAPLVSGPWYAGVPVRPPARFPSRSPPVTCL